jgi:hypothetical protein
MQQLIRPNPNIWCQPGWCLAYVNEAFGVAKRYGTATAAWNNSGTQHRDRRFPSGVWLPVWYELANEPAGHVVLLAPDGSCYSTSDLSNTPYHHPSLAHLEWFYAYYGMALTYRGWTEDVEGTPVIRPTISTQSTTTLQEDDDMALSPNFEPQVREALEIIVEAVDGFPIFDKNVRSVFDILRAQGDAQTATIAQLVTMLAGRERLDSQQIIDGVTDAIAARVKISATVEAPE